MSHTRLPYKTALSVVVLVAVLIVTGCENPTEDTDSTTTVGVVMPDAERWDRDLAELESQAEDSGIVIESFQSDDDQAKDTEIRQMISDGVQVLIVTASDSTASPAQDWPGLADAAEIPFINYDRLIQDVSGIDWYVTFDNEKVGQLQGQYVFDNTSDGDTIMIFRGPSSDPNAELFEDGALSVLQSAFDSATRTYYNDASYEIDNWSADDANTVVDGITKTSLDDVDALITANDGLYLGYASDSALGGIYRALADHGYTDSEISDLVIVGQDAQLKAVRAIVADPAIMSMTVLKDSREYVPYVIEAIEDLVAGTAPETTTTMDNGTESVPTYLATPVAVDADNVQEEIIDSGWYTQVEVYE